jgi:hypothetical protein
MSQTTAIFQTKKTDTLRNLTLMSLEKRTSEPVHTSPVYFHLQIDELIGVLPDCGKIK